MTREMGVSAVALLVVASVALAGVAPASVADAASADRFVTMTSTTTPDQPTTDGEFTFTMRFHSAAESGDATTIEGIEVRDGPGADADVLASRGYVGGDPPRLPAGGTVTQDIALSLEESGTHELFVEVTFGTGTERVTTTYRTNVTVYQPNPGLQASAAPTTAGEETQVTVDVANGLPGSVRDVDLSLAAEGIDFDDGSRVASSIASDATRSFAFTGTPSSLGTHEVAATLSYTTAEGTRRTVTRTLSVRFREPEFADDIGLAADVAPALSGADTTLNLTLTNGLDRAIRQLEVRVEADGATVAESRKVATGFESGTQRTFRFPVSRETPGTEDVTVTLSFTTADGVDGTVTETLTTTFEEPANPGAVRLTGASAVQAGGEVEISATASNVGAGEVSSVIVSVGDAAGVESADYFVGDIEAGDFSSFTLSPSVSGNVSSVPVTVTYVVDGVQRSTTTEVSVERRVVRQPGDGGGGNLPVVVGAIVLVLVVGAALVYRRRG